MSINKVITSKIFTTKEVIKVKPNAVITLALGGYTENEKGKPVLKDTACIVDKLAAFCSRNNCVIMSDQKGGLDFVSKEQIEAYFKKRI